MDEKVKRLLTVYTELDWDSRKEVRDFIKDFEEKDFTEKKSINESFRKSLGPLSSSSCPYCGK